ncbi:MAG: hypothetical protein AB1630_05885 [bacterium]
MAIKKWSKSEIIKVIRGIKKEGKPINPKYLKKNRKDLYGAIKRYFGGGKWREGWEKAVRAAGFLPEKERKWKKTISWSKTKVVQAIKKMKREGKGINQKSIMKNSPALLYAIKRYFGENKSIKEGWEKAVRAAGFLPEKERKKKKNISWSKSKIIQAIKKMKREGKEIHQTFIMKNFPSLLYAIRKHFGGGKSLKEGWEKAVRAAGFLPEKERKKKSWSKVKVIQAIRGIKKEGKPINPAYLNRTLYEAMKRYFGENKSLKEGWEKAVRAAGFLPEKERKKKKNISCSKSKIIQVIKKMKREGKGIHQRSIMKNFPSLLYAIRKHFGEKNKSLKEGWEKAVRAAGFLPEKERKWEKNILWSKSKIIQVIKKMKREGKGIHQRSIMKNFPSLLYAMKRYFGENKSTKEGWEKAVRAAGFLPEKETKKKSWSKSKIIQAIKKMKREGKEIHQTSIMKNFPSLLYAIRKHFGGGKSLKEGWEKAVRAAGFLPEKERKWEKNILWSKSKIIQAIKKMKREGKGINQTSIMKNFPSLVYAIRKHFGEKNKSLKEGWEKVVRAAGFSPDKERKKRKV